MIHHTKLFCFFLFIALAGFNTLGAQDTKGKIVTGLVRDIDGQAIPDVNVSVLDQFVQTFTDPEGKFSIQVGPGNSLYFSKQGYVAVTKEITAFIDSATFKNKIEKIIKDKLKDDKDLEDKIVEITKNVLTQLYKTLWTRRGFWRNDLKNKSS